MQVVTRTIEKALEKEKEKVSPGANPKKKWNEFLATCKAVKKLTLER
jgi:hypothetical protein